MPYEEYAEWQYKARTGYSREEYKRKIRKPRPRLTLQELADLTGFSRAYINDRERGLAHRLTGEPVQPGVDYIKKIAQVTKSDERVGRRLAGWAESDVIPKEEDLTRVMEESAGTRYYVPDLRQLQGSVMTEETANKLLQAIEQLTKLTKTPGE